MRRNETLTPAQLAALDAAAREAGKSWGFAAFLGLFVGIGAFTGGTAAGARVIVQMLFGLCFTVGALFLAGEVAPRAAIVLLAVFAVAMAVAGYVLGRRPSWKRSMRGTGRGTGWIANGSGGGSTERVGDVDAGQAREGHGDVDDLDAVSYTHLTLPTSDLV